MTTQVNLDLRNRLQLSPEQFAVLTNTDIFFIGELLEPVQSGENPPDPSLVCVLASLLSSLRKDGLLQSPSCISDDHRGNIYIAWPTVFCFLSSDRTWKILDQNGTTLMESTEYQALKTCIFSHL